MVDEPFADGQLALRTDAAVQQDPWRAVRAGRQHDAACPQLASGRRDPDRAVTVQHDTSTSVSARIVRFSCPRTGSRYANPTFQRTVPTALIGCTIAASPHASANARCHEESSSGSIRRTRI